uniref:Uncharacterized protein n=1 Tax=Acrobeloides nanus TaxID=290746 RepID=A0A914CYD2_9BILA
MAWMLDVNARAIGNWIEMGSSALHICFDAGSKGFKSPFLLAATRKNHLEQQNTPVANEIIEDT